ncbi:MAG: cyclase family protein [Chloroflexi bacterium]|nr:cyclase family protein [Chloroflexota bacterium]
MVIVDARRRLIDLNHVVTDGLITYPGLPAPVISEHLSRQDSRSRYAPGVEFSIGKIEIIANTGTYLDSPFHRYTDGQDLAQLPLERVADLEGVVLRTNISGRALTAAAAARAISAATFRDLDVRGKAVLVQTGWDRHWGTEKYGEGHPFLTADAAGYLIDSGAALVGIDSLNIDDTADLHRPSHSGLLKAGIPIVEHLRGLDQLPETGFRFFAVPVRVAGFGSFPVRAFAMVS